MSSAAESTKEECVVCYTELGITRRKATPNGCEHPFCVGCLERWAAKKNSCPVCRGVFVKYKVHGKRKRVCGVTDLRKSIRKEKERTKRIQLERVKRLFKKDMALRRTRTVTPADRELQQWIPIPRAEATEDDIADMEKAQSVFVGIGDYGNRTAPITLD